MSNSKWKDEEIIKLSSKTVMSFIAHPTDAVEVHHTISSMKNKNLVGHDGVSIQKLKYITPVCTEYIAYCFNDSILKSEFPQSLK